MALARIVEKRTENGISHSHTYSQKRRHPCQAARLPSPRAAAGFERDGVQAGAVCSSSSNNGIGGQSNAGRRLQSRRIKLVATAQSRNMANLVQSMKIDASNRAASSRRQQDSFFGLARAQSLKNANAGMHLFLRKKK